MTVMFIKGCGFFCCFFFHLCLDGYHMGAFFFLILRSNCTIFIIGLHLLSSLFVFPHCIHIYYRCQSLPSGYLLYYHKNKFWSALRTALLYLSTNELIIALETPVLLCTFFCHHISELLFTALLPLFKAFPIILCFNTTLLYL